MKELGIYVHIPFCKQKCYYCDFVSYSNKQEKVKEYVMSKMLVCGSNGRAQALIKTGGEEIPRHFYDSY